MSFVNNCLAFGISALFLFAGHNVYSHTQHFVLLFHDLCYFLFVPACLFMACILSNCLYTSKRNLLRSIVRETLAIFRLDRVSYRVVRRTKTNITLR